MVRLASFYALALMIMFGLFFALGYPKEIKKVELGERKLECVSYAPFEKNQSPFDFESGLVISESRIDKDLEILSKRFECVRTYSVTGLESIPKYAQKYNLKLLLGAWVSGTPKDTQKELKKVIEMAKSYPETVKAVIVGNETLLRREVSGEQLSRYIKEVKDELPQVPVTYADVWEFWLKNPDVAKATDFITIHILPYWEDDPIPVDKAIEHIRAIREEVKSKIPNKEILIGETGHPSFGRMREDSAPTLASQALYIRNFVEAAHKEGWRYNLIEAFDQPWKRVSEGAVGGYWGLYDADRVDKNVLSGEVSNMPNWLKLFGIAAILFLLSSLLVSRVSVGARETLVPIAVSFVGSVLLILQLNNYLYTVFNIWEWIWAIAVLGVVLTLSVQMLNRESDEREKESPLWQIFIFMMSVETVGLIFDGRYREFNNYAYGFGVLLYMFYAKDRKTQTLFVRTCALILIFGSVFILAHETLLNLQSDVWALLCALFGILLWRGSIGVALEPLLRYSLFALVAMALVLWVRYSIFGAEELIAFCEREPKSTICFVRSLLGHMMYLNIFGYLSVLFSLIAAIFGHRIFIFAAILMSLFALLIYNGTLGAIAFMITIFSITRGALLQKVTP